VHAASRQPDRSSPRVLVAEDQPHVREALRLLLKGAGYRITDVSTPAAVLEELAAGRYDALLLDLNYTRDTTSGAEGLELLPRIRQLDSTIPIVVLTAWGTVETAVKALHSGADDFVEKPWDNTKLLSLLRTQLEQGKALRKNHLERELEREELREIQRGLLPRAIPNVAGCEIFVDWRPAGDVGGDYFDVLSQGDGRVAVCIGDVAGKGLPAALLMSNLQASVRALAAENLAPADLCSRLNQVACANTANGRFITFLYAVLDARGGRVIYANAGHNAPLLVRGDGACERLTQGGPVLGQFPGAGYEPGEIAVQPGDKLVLFTDGIVEAPDGDEREFGEARLVGLVEQQRNLTGAALHKTVLEAVRAHCGGRLQDDVTLMVISVG
jgi:sigma-B regulation protein RsbU (phosphoserine phosphatase)